MGGGRGMVTNGQHLVTDSSYFDEYSYKSKMPLLDDFGYEEYKPKCKMVKVCEKKNPESNVKYQSEKVYFEHY